MLPGRLRSELTEFVGRRSELALVRQELGDARLVTLTGPGEIGKTRLALQAAAGALAERSLRLHRQSADQAGVVLALAQLGFIHLCSGELDAAADRYGECAQVAETQHRPMSARSEPAP